LHGNDTEYKTESSEARSVSVSRRREPLRAVRDSEGAVATQDFAGFLSSERLVTELSVQRTLKNLACGGFLRGDVEAFESELAARVAEMLGAELVEILKVVEPDRTLLLRAGVGFDRSQVGTARVGVNLASQAGYTMLRRCPVIVDDLRAERRFDAARLLVEHEVISGVTVPVCSEEECEFGETRCFGVLGAHVRTHRRFSDEEVHFLVEAGRILGAAYGRHFREQSRQEELRKARTRTAQLEASRAFDNELLEVLSTAGDEEAVAACAAEMAVPVLADWCFVDLVEGTGSNGSRRVRRSAVGPPDRSPESAALADELVGHYPVDLRGQHGTAKVLRTRRSELIRDVGDHLLQSIARDETGLSLLRRLQPRSYLGVPLYSETNLAGILVLIRCGPDSARYNEQDLELAERYALVLSLALSSTTNCHEPLQTGLRGQERGAGPADPDENLLPLLSPRQREVFEQLRDMKSNQEIGEALFISVNTVKSHIFRCRQIFGLEDRTALVKKARALTKGD
jgi:GAF domain-containing protein